MAECSNRTPALLLSFAIAIFSGCRGKDTRSPKYEPFNEAPQQAEPVENSGRTLSGAFVVAAAEDPYSAANPSQRAQTTISFDGSGEFRRESTRDGVAARRERGSYVIGSRGELVLYVEEIAGETLPSARAERYQISEQSDGRIVIEQSPGVQMVLQRK